MAVSGLGCAVYWLLIINFEEMVVFFGKLRLVCSLSLSPHLVGQSLIPSRIPLLLRAMEGELCGVATTGGVLTSTLFDGQALRKRLLLFGSRQARSCCVCFLFLLIVEVPVALCL